MSEQRIANISFFFDGFYSMYTILRLSKNKIERGKARKSHPIKINRSSVQVLASSPAGNDHGQSTRETERREKIPIGLSIAIRSCSSDRPKRERVTYIHIPFVAITDAP